MKESVYQIGKSKLLLRFGDITTAATDVIVSSDDFFLSMGGGVSRAILRAGGNDIAMDAAKHTPAQLGKVIVTTAGLLEAKYVFHAVTIGYPGSMAEPKDIVTSTTAKCFNCWTHSASNP